MKSNLRTVKRINSSTVNGTPLRSSRYANRLNHNNTLSHDKDFEQLETNVNANFSEIETIVENKLNELNMKEEGINNFNTILEKHLNQVNDIVTKNLDTHRTTEPDYKEKYHTILGKYIKLKNHQEENFLRMNKLIISYQSLLIKMCSNSIGTSDNLSSCKEECDIMQQVLNSVRTEDYENEQREVIITNPIVNRRYSNPVIKTKGKEKDEVAMAQYRDDELKALFDNEDEY